ncbi:uncharacterized protein LOC111044034 [Nilaparvata lugens]|uniref:uncharacterized protein LOC111044034 n=1 Tax=Nilaparvata lugens TaxID=108931 RepID=UPI000B984595|nr:uncharacterized protein LOC111044034 [Nilaparvata lugens]
MKSLVFVVLFVAVEVRSAIIREGVEIPTYSVPCKRTDPKLDQCILKGLRAFIAAVAKDGVKEIGVPPLDPFYMPELLTTYKNNDMQASVLLKNIFTHGAMNAEIKAIRSDFSNPEKIIIEADTHSNEMFSEGTYKMEGKVGNFVLNGRGVYNVTMYNIDDTVHVELKVVEIDGEEFLKVTKVMVDPEIGDMKMYASNLVNGNPELSKIANQFANQFWKLFYKEMMPIAQENVDKIAKSLMNKALLTIPYNQLLPN